jgi:uncharacterized protein GlcG (DUF336 family)
MALRLAEANRAIQAILAKANDLEFNISVSVCDADGHLVAHQRMDDTFAEAPRGSIGKPNRRLDLRLPRKRFLPLRKNGKRKTNARDKRGTQ